MAPVVEPEEGRAQFVGQSFDVPDTLESIDKFSCHCSSQLHRMPRSRNDTR